MRLESFKSVVKTLRRRDWVYVVGGTLLLVIE